MFYKSDSEKEIQELLPLIDVYITMLMINLGKEEAEKARVMYSVERLRSLSSEQRQQLLIKLREILSTQKKFSDEISKGLEEYKKKYPNR